MKKVRLTNGSAREALLEERTAKLLVLSGKAEYVDEHPAPEAAVLRSAPNYMRRHPEARER